MLAMSCSCAHAGGLVPHGARCRGRAAVCQRGCALPAAMEPARKARCVCYCTCQAIPWTRPAVFRQLVCLQDKLEPALPCISPGLLRACTHMPVAQTSVLCRHGHAPHPRAGAPVRERDPAACGRLHVTPAHPAALLARQLDGAPWLCAHSCTSSVVASRSRLLHALQLRICMSEGPQRGVTCLYSAVQAM